MKTDRNVKCSIRISIFIAVVVLLGIFNGCASDGKADAWHEQLSLTAGEKNYTVCVTTCESGAAQPVTEKTAAYDGSKTQITTVKEDTQTDVYYTRDGEEYRKIIRNDDRNAWVETEIKADQNLFYAHDVIERLKLYTPLIDSGKLSYDEKTHSYKGETELGEIEIGGKKHQLKSLEIKIRDNRVRYVKETYDLTVDGKTRSFTDEIEFDSFGRTEIKLPERILTEAALKLEDDVTESADEIKADISAGFDRLREIEKEISN